MHQRLAPLLLALISFVVLFSPVAWAQGGDDGVLVLGRISDDPSTHYQQLKPLLDYVVPRMADVGIREGRILMARDAQQMASYLRRGRVDWVNETVGTGMTLQQRAGARPLLMTERDGVSNYRTVLVARRDSGIRELQDLRGRSVAFQNAASTSAYFVPAAELLAQNLSLTLLLSPQDRPPIDAVGYVFARSELNICTWVHKRLVDAGAMSNLDFDNPARVPPAYRKDLVIVHASDPYPRALEMVRAGLDERVARRLQEVLLEAGNDPAAREALLRFFKTTRFLEIDDESRRALASLSRGVARVRSEVE